MPIFSGVVLCPSGINDILRRTQINKILTQHQGTYLKNLERPVKVTHLLCSGDEETDKMRYAEKFNSRKEANIHLVWEEWFWDSYDFGGTDIHLSPYLTPFMLSYAQQQADLTRRNTTSGGLGQNARPTPNVCRHCPLPIATTQLTHRLRPVPPSSPTEDEADTEPPPPSKRPPPPKQNTSNNDPPEDEVVASVKRVPHVTLQLWESLLKPRGFELTNDGSLQLSPSKSKAAVPLSVPSEENQTHPGGSVISAFRRANSFVVNNGALKPGRQPFRRIPSAATALSFAPKKITNREEHAPESSFMVPPPPASPAAGVAGPSRSSSSAVFSGLTFRALGEARTTSVRNAVEQGGGVMVSADDEDDAGVDFIIVRLVRYVFP